MNRDAILATLIGLGLGLFMTGILILGPGLLKYFPKISVPFSFGKNTANIPTPTPTPAVFTVTIDSPLPEAIAESGTLVISGTTFPKSKVVVSGPVDDDVVIVPDDGKYAGKITLVEGKNDIVVTSYFDTKHTEQKVTVYYTKEAL